MHQSLKKTLFEDVAQTISWVMVGEPIKSEWEAHHVFTEHFK